MIKRSISSVLSGLIAMYLVTKLHFHRKSNTLDVHFDDDVIYTLSCEYLRTHSPSAEVQGHGVEQSKLILNKETVSIKGLDPVGHYAVRLNFDDGHNSGLFSWQYLRELGANYHTNWRTYCDRVDEYNQQMHTVPIKFIP